VTAYRRHLLQPLNIKIIEKGHFMLYFIIIPLLVHSGSIAKSKGYYSHWLLRLTYLICGIGVILSVAVDRPNNFLFSLVLLPTIFAWSYMKFLLRAKEGARGKEFFTIKFSCPFCQEDLEFARRLEGRKDHCTSCKEIITVTTDSAVHQEALDIHHKMMGQMASIPDKFMDSNNQEML